MKKNRGFSLVELIIAVGIMAVLAAAIAPSLIRYINKAKKADDIVAAETVGTAFQAASIDDEDVRAYVDRQRYWAEKENRIRIVCYFDSPSNNTKYQATVQIPDIDADLSKVGIDKDNLLDKLDSYLTQTIVPMRFSAFQYLDQYVVAIDKDGNIYVFFTTGIAHSFAILGPDDDGMYYGSNGYGGKCYEVWPAQSEQYMEMSVPTDAQTKASGS